MEQELMSQLEDLMSSQQISENRIVKLLNSYLGRILEMVLENEG